MHLKNRNWNKKGGKKEIANDYRPVAPLTVKVVH
jgi:hypothetical protein